jgi:acyl-CoA reductase-like NAD-dependent aldehyde dehydrogenase
VTAFFTRSIDMTESTVPAGIYPSVLPETETFLSRPHPLLIGGEADPVDGGSIDVIDPSTGRCITSVAEGCAADVDRAVKAAQAAFTGSWSEAAPQMRERLLIALAELIESNAQHLAELEVIDTGKPLRNARAEVALAASVFRYYAGWPTKASGEVNPSSASLFNYSVREPVGVCGQITAWNYPFLLASWKLAPALAFGNTAVLKPPELAPLSSLRLGELCLEAGFPEGVVSVLPGYGQTAGQALVDHPDVDKIAFTGSTAVGKHIAATAAASMKRVTLELGGKSPNIVFADADLKAAARGAVRGIFWNSGQVCVAGSRLFIQRPIATEFVDAVVTQTAKLRLGQGFEPGADMGPLISEQHRQRVLGYVAAGLEDGAELAAGGHAPAHDGYFVEPTVFTGVTPVMRIAAEEIFGPVLSVIPFDDEEEVTHLANDSRFGLAAAIWTRDVARAHTLARRIKAGTVWVNTFGAMEPNTSFGGFKESGVGRELGSHSIEAYTEVKSVYTSLA